MFRVTRKEEIFFDYFVETVENACKASDLLDELIHNYTDVGEKINKIEEVEHSGDQHVHKILDQLNKSFITPIDREDIYSIAKELDNITDSIESTAHRFQMFNVKEMNENAVKLSKMICECTRELKAVMQELKDMKTSKLLQKKIIEVNRIEDDADTIFRDAMTELFASPKDPLEVIRWKEIYEYLENTIDACEDVANIVEGVVTKHV